MLVKQKSRVQYLKERDSNTTYFLKCINERRNVNNIFLIKREDGNWASDLNSTKSVLIDHFRNLFEDKILVQNVSRLVDLFKMKISCDKANKMVKEVTEDKIEKTMFSLTNNKASSLDRYNANFFKKTWSIVGEDVLKVIQSFFATEDLLKEINSTIIVLVQKCSNHSACRDYRIISYCNTIYKCITNILANRIKGCFPRSLIMPK